jgi:hypothetical protein
MKHVEDTWPKKFKDEARSLGLIIAMGSVNPYSLQNTNYYVWAPVVVINKNIPPIVVCEEWTSYVDSYSPW